MRRISRLSGLLLLGACPALQAQEKPNAVGARPAPVTGAAAAAVPGHADDEKALGALVAAYTKAFNAGDAGAAAATFAEDALVVDEQGERTEGRAAIRDRLAAAFSDSPGDRIAVQTGARRFLGPDTALEEGRTT